MKYESTILKRLIDTYGVVGNPRYISEIIKEFIVRGKECFPNLFTYQSDWLAHIDEFGLNPSYTVSYTGQSIYAPNTLERPVISAILKGCTKYTNDNGDVFDKFFTPIIVNWSSGYVDDDGTIADGGHYVTQFIDIAGFDGFNFGIDETRYAKIGFYDENKTFISRSMGSENGTHGIVMSQTFPPHTKYIRASFTTKNVYFKDFYNRDLTLPLSLSNVKMPVLTTSNEDGTKTNILSTPSDLELRGIGDVQDTLDCLTGEVVERIGEIVLDGSETWREWSTTETSYGFALWNTLKDFKPRTIPICNALLSYNFNNFSSKDKGVALYTTNTSSYSIFIRLPKTECTGLEDFKTNLQTNPITVQYELETESIKTVELTILDQNGQSVDHLKSFNGGTHLYTSSLEGSLVPSVDISVVTNLEETLKICSLEGNTM